MTNAVTPEVAAFLTRLAEVAPRPAPAGRPSLRSQIAGRWFLFEAVFTPESLKEAVIWWETAGDGDQFTLATRSHPELSMNLTCRGTVGIPTTPSTAGSWPPDPHSVGMSEPLSDPVNHPKHYNSHPSGVEVITITRLLDSDSGNPFKYIARHPHKGKPVEDLDKAIFYLNDAITFWDEVPHNHLNPVWLFVVAPILIERSDRYLAHEPDGPAKAALQAIVDCNLGRGGIELLSWARDECVAAIRALQTPAVAA